MRCLKLFPSKPDPVKAKFCKISNKIVSKECLTNGNSIWIYHFSEMRAFLNARLNCIFKFGPFLTSNLSSDINFEASVVIFILRLVMTSLYLYIK